MKKMKLLAFKYDEIFDLADQAKKILDERGDHDYRSHVGNFLVDVSLEKELEFYDILERRDYYDMQLFIRDNPTIDINLDGDSEPKNYNPYEIMMASLEASYQLAKTSKRTNQARQIIDARELKCLDTVKKYDYRFEKLKIKDRNIADEVIKYENIKEFNVIDFLTLVIEYFRNHPKDNVFVDYVFSYLDLFLVDNDKLNNMKEMYKNNIKELFERRGNK